MLGLPFQITPSLLFQQTARNQISFRISITDVTGASSSRPVSWLCQPTIVAHQPSLATDDLALLSRSSKLKGIVFSDQVGTR